MKLEDCEEAFEAIKAATGKILFQRSRTKEKVRQRGLFGMEMCAIEISEKTEKRLEKLRRKGETYDELLERLINFYLEKGKE